MGKITLTIKKITIISQPGRTDFISIVVDMPTTMPGAYEGEDSYLVLKAEAPRGSGTQYVKDNFKIDESLVEIIDVG